ncbi:MAG TPA: hypothetical protein VGS41_09530 [Chthonomonadales bacterium]|nr:hypothetical protein [Chthonomonadales bacterium]
MHFSMRIAAALLHPGAIGRPQPICGSTKPRIVARCSNGLALAGCLALVLGSAPARTQSLYESFDDPALSGWTAVPGVGTYSLTDNPGSLRYHLLGQAGSGYWRTQFQNPGGWAPGTSLIRGFTGANWVMDIHASYNLHEFFGDGSSQGDSTGAQGMIIWVQFGSGVNDCVKLARQTDYWYSFNKFGADFMTGGAWV